MLTRTGLAKKLKLVIPTKEDWQPSFYRQETMTFAVIWDQVGLGQKATTRNPCPCSSPITVSSLLVCHALIPRHINNPQPYHSGVRLSGFWQKTVSSRSTKGASSRLARGASSRLVKGVFSR